MTALAFGLPPRLEAPAAARARRRAAAGRQPPDGAIAHARFAELPQLLEPATCSWSTCRRRCPPRSPRPAPTGPAGWCALSPPAPRAPTTAGGWSSCAAATAPRRLRGRRLASRLRLAGGRAASSSLAPYARGRDSGWRAWRPTGPVLEHLRRPRPADPLRLRRPATGRSTPTRTSTPRARQRRDAERRPPVHARAADPAGRRAASRSRPILLHTGVSSPERHEPPYPERYGVPDGHRARWSTPPAAAGGRVDRGRHDRRPRARDGRRPRRHGRRRRGLDRPGRSTPDARPARGRRADHRLARARGLAPAAARGARRTEPLLERCYAGALSTTATSGTSSATAT